MAELFPLLLAWTAVLHLGCLLVFGKAHLCHLPELAYSESHLALLQKMGDVRQGLNQEHCDVNHPVV